MLFVPGHRPDRFDKAAQVADIAVIDLEDAVDVDAKRHARVAVRTWLRAGGQAVVRVNAAGTPWHEADVHALRNIPTLRAIMLPKAESAAQCERAHRDAGEESPIVALTESALGLAAVDAIANSPAVVRLAFGSIDYALDIAANESWDAMLWARSSIVQASRAAGLAGPIDGVTTSLDAPERAAEDARKARGLGFAAKLCIHPAQIEGVAAAFEPSFDEVTWAREVLAAGSTGAARIRSQMVDKPVRIRAERILAFASERQSDTEPHAQT
jgi:citrate lyase subunit beta/citryl-CoA lyase